MDALNSADMLLLGAFRFDRRSRALFHIDGFARKWLFAREWQNLHENAAVHRLLRGFFRYIIYRNQPARSERGRPTFFPRHRPRVPSGRPRAQTRGVRDRCRSAAGPARRTIRCSSHLSRGAGPAGRRASLRRPECKGRGDLHSLLRHTRLAQRTVNRFDQRAWFLLATRVCAVCGETKDVEGGMMCEKGHFICWSCSGKGKGIFLDYTISRCPIDNTKVT
jgi:hypothetical protein